MKTVNMHKSLEKIKCALHAPTIIVVRRNEFNKCGVDPVHMGQFDSVLRTALLSSHLSEEHG